VPADCRRSLARVPRQHCSTDDLPAGGSSLTVRRVSLAAVGATVATSDSRCQYQHRPLAMVS